MKNLNSKVCLFAFCILFSNIINAKKTEDPTDSVTKVAFSAKYTQSIWVPCGSEDENCNIASQDVDKFTTVRYGLDDKGLYSFQFTKGIEAFPCNNQMGDPEYGVVKSCSYTTGALKYVDQFSNWNHFLNEGQSGELAVAPGKQVWVRYGKDNKWFYTLVDGGNAQKLICENSSFGGRDPFQDNVKTCEYGPVFKESKKPYTICATEGNLCNPQIQEPFIVKYGKGKDTTIRYILAPLGFNCSNEMFSRDPADGKVKECSYITAISPNAITTGKWAQIVTCHSDNCTLSETLVTGTETSNSWSNTSEWGLSVTTSIESESNFVVGKTAVKASVTSSYSKSETFQKALSESRQKRVSATCPSTSAGTLGMYQFHTSTTQDCLFNGSCIGTTNVPHYLCISNIPAGYIGPQCLPNYCADALCTKCTY